MPNLKNVPGKGLCGWCFICLGPLPSYEAMTPFLPPPPTYILHSVYVYTGGGGRGEKVMGAIVHKVRSKIPILLTVSQVYSTVYTLLTTSKDDILGAIVHKVRSKIPILLTVSQVYSTVYTLLTTSKDDI
jgi:hypothetical protein